MKTLSFIFMILLSSLTASAQLKVTSGNRAYLGNSSCYANGPDREKLSGVGRIISGEITGGNTRPGEMPEGILNTWGGISSAVDNNGDYTFSSNKVYYFNSQVNASVSPSFYVTGEGQTYSRLGYIQSSDSTNKENISEIAATLPKIKALRGVVFDYKSDKDETSASTLSRSAASSDPIAQQREQEKDRKRIGLIAQEVEKVLPEVVRTLPDGSKGIMYGDIVAVLIEGMKEMQDSIVSLRQELNEIRQMLNVPGGQAPALQPGNGDNASGSNTLDQGEAKLYQNTPNPFNQETEIGYKISNGANSASVCIYNLNGQQLKKYPLNMDSRKGKVTVSASEFSAGIYIYSLVIDNRVIDSKRMTLTD